MKGKINPKDFSPESLMMSYGYRPEWSEGAVKPPIFQTSTYAFETAEDGKAFFEVAYGLRELGPDEAEPGLIYSRLNNPNMEILENRLSLWDEADDAAVFASGMAAISTALMTFLKPGDLLLYNKPLYGGTLHFIEHILSAWGVHILAFNAWDDEPDIRALLENSPHKDRLKMIYIETPANPTNHVTDIQACANIAKAHSTEDHKVIFAVDNTYLGPLWQKPLALGADIAVYSATKFIAGHSDLIAGAIMGKQEEIDLLKVNRAFYGNMPSAWKAWLMLRSLETLQIRMEKQLQNALAIAHAIQDHPAITKLLYLEYMERHSKRDHEIYEKQCLAPGSMMAFEIKGGEKAAFKFLNSLKLLKLAVSLGSTESLVEHPGTMTHAGMDHEDKIAHGVTPGLVRISVGVENPDDLIKDIKQALEVAMEVAEGLPA